jgi:hypothetical protein
MQTLAVTAACVSKQLRSCQHPLAAFDVLAIWLNFPVRATLRNSAATDGSIRGSIDQTTGTTYTFQASRIQWNTDSLGKEYL